MGLASKIVSGLIMAFFYALWELVVKKFWFTYVIKEASLINIGTTALGFFCFVVVTSWATTWYLSHKLESEA